MLTETSSSVECGNDRARNELTHNFSLLFNVMLDLNAFLIRHVNTALNLIRKSLI